MPDLVRRFKDRKMVQWALAYLAGAWVVFETTDAVGSRWSLPDVLYQGLAVVLGVGFLVVLVIAWYHGEQGRQRVSGPELLIIALLLAIAGTTLTVLDAGEDAGALAPVSGRPALAEGSIAVLPWENRSARPEDLYFTEGIHDELLTSLSRIGALDVRSRTSVMAYRDAPKNLRTISEELQARYILEGGLLRAGDTVRINVQLIDATMDAHVWSETYDRLLSPENMLEVQSGITREVTAAIGVTLTEDESFDVGHRGTINAEAWDAYLRGRFHWNRRTAEGLGLALRLFREAVTLDPEYAEAHAGLADTQVMLAGYAIVPTQPACPEAIAAAHRAIELNARLAAPHASLGFILTLCEHDWSASEEHFERALELEPDYATAHHWYAWTLAAQRNFEEAVLRVERAQALSPLSMIIGSAAGWILTSAGSYERAESQFQRILEMDAEFPRTHMWLGSLLALRGRHDEAELHARRGHELTDGHPQYVSNLAFVLGRAGRSDEATDLVRQLRNRAEGEFISPYDIAVAHVGLGEVESALDELERAVVLKDFWAALMAGDPRLESLWEHPRFQTLLDELNLTISAS